MFCYAHATFKLYNQEAHTSFAEDILMPERSNFFEYTLAKLQEDNYLDAGVRLTEEYSTSKPEDFKQSLKKLNTALAKREMPTLDIKYSPDGELISVGQKRGPWADFFDPLPALFVKQTSIGPKISDPELERLAQHFENVKCLTQDRPHVVLSARFLLDRSFKLDKDSQELVLKRAGDLSLSLPGSTLNVVFADSERGRQTDLSDVAVNYVYKFGTTTKPAVRERIDIYDPPLKK
jgi:hypothetical protein